MIDFSTLMTKPVAKKGNLITIYGENKSGKTSLAATFNKPIFIRCEDGTDTLQDYSTKYGLDITILPVCQGSQDVTEQLLWLQNNEHDFKTIIIDSISALSKMFESEIMARDGKSTVAECNGGYGKGISEVANRHAGFVLFCDSIATSLGINIIFISHRNIVVR